MPSYWELDRSKPLHHFPPPWSEGAMVHSAFTPQKRIRADVGKDRREKAFRVGGPAWAKPPRGTLLLTFREDRVAWAIGSLGAQRERYWCVCSPLWFLNPLNTLRTTLWHQLLNADLTGKETEVQRPVATSLGSETWKSAELRFEFKAVCAFPQTPQL